MLSLIEMKPAAMCRVQSDDPLLPVWKRVMADILSWKAFSGGRVYSWSSTKFRSYRTLLSPSEIAIISALIDNLPFSFCLELLTIMAPSPKLINIRNAISSYHELQKLHRYRHKYWRLSPFSCRTRSRDPLRYLRIRTDFDKLLTAGLVARNDTGNKMSGRIRFAT